MKVLIIYHHKCADGSFAAAISGLAHADDIVHYMASNYVPNDGDILDVNGVRLDQMPTIMQTNPVVKQIVEDVEVEVVEEGVQYDKVIVVDFSLSERQMAVMTQRFGTNFVVLDHHNVRTQQGYDAECRAIGVHPNPEMIFNAAGSGALLAYMKNLSRFNSPRYARYLGNLIRMAQLVSDRDTWQRHITKAFEFYEGYAPELFSDPEAGGIIFESLPSTVAKARFLIMNGDIEELRAIGRDRIVKRNEKIAQMIKHNSYFSNGEGGLMFNHVVLPAPRALGSEAAQFVFENYPHFQLVIMPRITDKQPDTVFVSVRSIGCNGTEPHSAKQVAMQFTGNGHGNAAGFQMSRKQFEQMYPQVRLAHEEQDVVCC